MLWVQADGACYEGDSNDGSECGARRATLLTPACTGVDPIDSVRRNGHAEITRMQDVA